MADENKEQLDEYIQVSQLSKENVEAAFDDTTSTSPKEESAVMVETEQTEQTEEPPIEELQPQPDYSAGDTTVTAATTANTTTEMTTINKGENENKDGNDYNNNEDNAPIEDLQPQPEEEEKYSASNDKPTDDNNNKDDKPETEAPESKEEYKDDSKEESKDPNETIILQTIFDRDQTVPKIVHNKDPNHTLNSVDKDWKYNMTLGDIQLRTITHYDGKKETLWFPLEEYPKEYYPEEKSDDDDKKKKKKKKKETPPRKVFVALKVKRVSAVDNIAETVKCCIYCYMVFCVHLCDFARMICSFF